VGVVSSVVLGAWESHVHGEGLDGSTQPAQETHAGQSWIGHRCANLPAGDSEDGKSQQAPSLSGSLPAAEHRDAASGVAGLEEERRDCRYRYHGQAVRGTTGGQSGRIGRTAEAEEIPGETGQTAIHTEGQRQTAPPWHPGPGGQTRPEGGGHGPDGHLRAGFFGLLVWLPIGQGGQGRGGRSGVPASVRRVRLHRGSRYQRLLR